MRTLRSLYWESTRSVRFVTILVCILGAVGVWFRRDSDAGDFHLLLHLAPWWAWFCALLAIAFQRYWCLWRSAICHHDCMEQGKGMWTCVLALWVWSCILASSAVASDFGLALMLLVCDVLEAWLLSRHVLQKRSKKAVK